MMAVSRRCAGGRGDLVSWTIVVDCIQYQRGGAAGDMQGGGVLWVLDGGVDLRRVIPSQVVRGMRRRNVERIGGKEERGVILINVI
jgi:hypothetical protein